MPASGSTPGRAGSGTALAVVMASIHHFRKEDIMQTFRRAAEIALPVAIVVCCLGPFFVGA